MDITELIKLADDAYYATQYEKAIDFYEQALELDPKNEHAQSQLKKAESNRSLKRTPPELPVQAIQLYKRSRSFITAGDLSEAEKLLKQAVSLAEDAGVEFPQAEELLNNLSNALKAAEFKQEAYKNIDTQQWTKAIDNLYSATNLDSSDEITQTLLLHLQNLFKARNMVDQLNAGIDTAKKRSEVIQEILQIIELTNETAPLSTLWQDVVRLFGEYNKKNSVFQNKNIIFQWSMMACLLISVILLITFGALYLYPRHRGLVLVCDAIAPGLIAKLDYPYYVANRDPDEIGITFINNSDAVINDRFIEIKFTGTANLKYVDPSNSNEIKLEGLNPDKEQPETISFFIDGSTNRSQGPWYISFNVGACTPNGFYIAMTPIQGLRKYATALWGIFIGSILGLLKDQIKDFLTMATSFLKKSNN